MSALFVTCSHPHCNAPDVAECDNCLARFCSDHGTKGGDRETQDVGMVAVPSLCWKCGGFDADEGFEDEAERKSYIASLVDGLKEAAE